MAASDDFLYSLGPSFEQATVLKPNFQQQLPQLYERQCSPRVWTTVVKTTLRHACRARTAP